MKLVKKKKYYELDFGLNSKSIIVLILVLASLVINLFYFSTNTGIWWDEAEYLSFVNHIVKGSPFSLWEGRMIFYPLMMSIFGMNEVTLKIGLVIISCLTTYFTFVVIDKLFKTKIAIITTILFLTNYLYNFFSLRFLTGIPSLMFILIGIYFFLNNKTKHRLYAGLFLGCAIATRFTSVLVIPALILYDLFNDNIKISVKGIIDYAKNNYKKYVWIPALLLGFVPTAIFDVINGNPAWETFYNFISQSMMERSWGRNLGEWYYYIQNLPAILGIEAIVFLIIGILFLLTQLKTKRLNKIILIITFILLHLISYSFLTQLKEQRYIMPILPFIYAITAFGIISISTSIGKLITKKTKLPHADKILIGLIMLFIIIPSLQSGYYAINYSANSYEELRLAGEFLKENIQTNEIIMTNAGPHISYHSQREITGFPANMTDLYTTLENNENINHLVFSFYETIPNYINDFVNNSDFALVQDYYRGESLSVLSIVYLRE